MGWRYRKSVKILPGVKLNFNKKSTSISFGGKGHHTTINSKGKATRTVGIPGTGLYHTSTISNKQAAPRKQYSPKFYRICGTIIQILAVFIAVLGLLLTFVFPFFLLFVLFAVFLFIVGKKYKAIAAKEMGEQDGH